MHIINFIGEAAEATGDGIVLDELEGSRRLVDHVVRAQDEAMDVLDGLTALTLLGKSSAHFDQSGHENIIAREISEQLVNVPAWTGYNAAHEVTEGFLVGACLAVHVVRVGCWEQGDRCVLVSWISPGRVLLDHEAADGAQLNHILPDGL